MRHPWKHKTCPSGKMAFVSAEQAEIYYATKSTFVEQRANYIYECGMCGQWHFTKQRGGGSRKMKVHG